MPLKISVVVCTYNRAATLARMLASFYPQRGSEAIPHELIVVDNNSADGTRDVVQPHLAQPGCRYCFEPRQGLSAARNRGVAEAEGEVIAFLDDDVIVDAGWLQGLAQCFTQTGADAVGGRTHLRLEAPAPEWLGPFFRDLLSEVDHGPDRLLRPTGQGLWGVNLAFRKQALLAAGGFDERLGRSGGLLLGGEETALLARIEAAAGRIVYEPAAVVEHLIGPERLRWAYFASLARAGGMTRRLRDRPCPAAWQLLRVLRSAIELGLRQLRLFTLRLRRSPAYEAQTAAWWRELHAAYLALRWRDLLHRRPAA